jgi:hypothetical protein|tara:strand:+ start:1136 stop:1651 length:516 start_codon:yes stop_codon:yes gene_type:complete
MVKIKDIETLLAEQAIRKVVTFYSRGCDRCDVDIFKLAFHDDAEVKYGTYDGHYEKFCNDIVTGNLTLKDTSHTIINEHYNIDVNANQGTGEIYVLAFWGSEGFNYTCSGRYLDKYECRDGDWRISFRQYIYDWSRTTKYRGDDPNQIFSGLKYKGTQNKDDISYKILGKS